MGCVWVYMLKVGYAIGGNMMVTRDEIFLFGDAILDSG